MKIELPDAGATEALGAALAGALDNLDATLTAIATANNPFFEGAHSDALSMLPFLLATIWLYLAGRDQPTTHAAKVTSAAP